MKKLYLCEYCEASFESEIQCIEHEKTHVKIEDLLKKYPGSIICPRCKGEGITLAKIGYFVCSTCGGKRIVFEEKHTTTVYKQV